MATCIISTVRKTSNQESQQANPRMVYLNHRHGSRDPTQAGKSSSKLNRPHAKPDLSPGHVRIRRRRAPENPSRGTAALGGTARRNGGTERRKPRNFPPNRARLSSRRRLDHRRASIWEVCGANPTRLGFMGRGVGDFSLLFSIFSREREMQGKCCDASGECFPFSLSPSAAALILGSERWCRR